MSTLSLAIKALSVTQGATLKLSNSLFTVGALDYSLKIEVVGGSLYRSGSAIGSSGIFSVTELKSGVVSFVANGNTAPVFTVSASAAGFEDSASLQASLTFHSVNQAPTLSLTGLASAAAPLLKGGSVVITRDMIDAADTETSGIGAISFKVIKVSGGSFLLNGFAAKGFSLADIEHGSVSFQHDGKLVAPSFTLQAIDGDGKASGSISVSSSGVYFDALNTATPGVADPHELAVKTPIAVTEGATLKLSTGNLPIALPAGLTVADLPALTVRIDRADHLQVLVKGKIGSQSSFTVDDLKKGLVSVKHDGTQSPPDVQLSLLKGSTLIDTLRLPLSFKVVNDLPLLAVNNLASYLNLSRADHVIDRNLFSWFDEETPVALEGAYLFTVKSAKGLEFHRQGLTAAIKSFTLADVDAGLISVNRLALTTGEAAFSLTITDPSGKVSTVISGAANHVHGGSVSISGIATLGHTLHATSSLYDADGLGAISYTWVDQKGAILGTGSNLAMTSANAGRQISVVGSYVDGCGSTEVAKSYAVTSALTATHRSSAEFQVNGTSTGVQDEPVVAALSDGGYLVVWTANGQDGSLEGIYAQRYLANGQATGSEFKVNTYTLSAQDMPSVAGLKGGGAIVTWSSPGHDDMEPGLWPGIFGQLYDVDGTADGGEFQISNSSFSASGSKVTALSNDGFVVTWYSDEGLGTDYDVYAQCFDASGDAVGSEIRVSSYSDGWQYFPSVASLSGGGFVVTWISKDYYDPDPTHSQDGSNSGIYGQRFNGSGVALGSEFQVNSYVDGAQYAPAVTGLADGGFVVTWSSDGQDGFNTGIYAQRYAADGTRSGSEIQVNTYTYRSQYDPSITALKDGGFVITWDSFYQDAFGGTGVYAQRFAADGSRSGGEFLVNSYTESHQTNSNLVGLSDGGYLVAWQSYYQDGADQGIYAQRFGATENPVPTATWLALSGYDNIIGDAANDTVTAIGKDDIVYTNGGDDSMAISGTAFGFLDGAGGYDTLHLTGNLDLVALHDRRITNIEEIHLVKGGTLKLAASDVLAMSDVFMLKVTGSTGTVDIVDAGGTWVTGAVVNGFETYTQGLATLLVQQVLNVV